MGGSLYLETGRANADAIIPTTGMSHKARISDFASTFTTSFMGIDLAIKTSSSSDVVIHTDSFNAIRKIADHDPKIHWLYHFRHNWWTGNILETSLPCTGCHPMLADPVMKKQTELL
jgi:hypothetical protein